MKEYRYIYEPRKKHTCPNCGQKTFKRFLDTETGELLPEDFGSCERIFSCNYEKRPARKMVEREPIQRPVLIPFYFDEKILIESQQKIMYNILFSFFVEKFGGEKTKKCFEKYNVGTSIYGETIFWQIDEQGKIRAGKKIEYFSDGHRNKAKGANWLHWSNGFLESQHQLNQCLFGQHLMNEKYKEIFIVESEKTALICDICKKEDVLFLACGGLQNLGLVAKLKINPDQKIWLIPDNDGNEIWQQKIEKLNLNAEIKIIPKLQEMKKGSDVGDLLLNN